MADFEKADVDMVNRPPHYNREGAMECFDEFMLIYGKEAAKHACLFNIHKYRYRAADKNGQEDLKKSDWYMRKYKELCIEDEIKNTTYVSIQAQKDPLYINNSSKNDYGQF